MKTRRLDPQDVVVPNRLRALDFDKANHLAESMDRLGLLQPITVYIENGAPHLVIGRHRLAAAIKLGWDKIDAIVTEADEIGRELSEIDENLIRAELSPAERDQHLARRKELWAARKTAEQEAEKPTPESQPVDKDAEKSGRVAPTLDKRGRGAKGFASDTAQTTGLEKRTINEGIARTQKIPKDVYEAVAGTELDKVTYLRKLTALDADEQRKKVQADLAAPPKPKRQPKPKPDELPEGRRWIGVLMDAWQRASKEERQEFLDWVGVSSQ